MSEEFLTTASSIAARLCRDALWDDSRCNWLGDDLMMHNGVRTVILRSFGPDLYSGTAGIGLFLAHIARATGERIFKKVAQGAYHHCRDHWEATDESEAAFGLYSGLAGIAYACESMGRCLEDSEMISTADKVVDRLICLTPVSDACDLIVGSAGTIIGLLALYRIRQNDKLLEAAIRHGDLLLDCAVRSEAGASWYTLGNTAGSQEPNLTGLAHGVSGIAWALAELYGVTKEKKYRDTVMHGLDYENACFNSEFRNWPDFRMQAKNMDGFSCATYWCHGAPGIGMARLRIFELLSEKQCLLEAETAMATTRNWLEQAMAGGAGNFSLCHGLAGNAELFVEAGMRLGKREYLEVACATGQYGIQQYKQTQSLWPCGVEGGGDVPGLMLGTAGIGMFFLRLYDHTAAPSTLMVC